MYMRSGSVEERRRDDTVQARPGVAGGRDHLKCEVCGRALFYGRERDEGRCIHHPRSKPCR